MAPSSLQAQRSFLMVTSPSSRLLHHHGDAIGEVHIDAQGGDGGGLDLEKDTLQENPEVFGLHYIP